MESTAFLSPDAIAGYRRDGAVALRGTFSPSWIASLAQAVDRVIAEPGPLARHNTAPGKPGMFFVDFCMWRRFPEFREFALRSPAAEIAASLMGTRTVNFYHDHLLVKEPGTEERTLWHHDQPYWPIDGQQVCSIWLPLDPVPRSICPEWVRGSHLWGRWFAPRFFRDARALVPSEGTFEPVPDIDGRRAEYEFLSWDMQPGDCVAFHALTLHGAPGNSSLVQRRRAYATRWTGDDAVYAARPGEISPPITGHGLKPGDPLDCEMFPRVWPPKAGED